MLVREAPKSSAIFASLEQAKHDALVAADNGDAPLCLFGKVGENARRIALTVAAFRNPAHPLVGATDADYGIRLATLCAADLVAQVRERVANNAAERNKQRVLLAIRRAGAHGLTRSELTRATRSLRPAERDDALLDLIDSEEIVESQELGTGLKAVARYTASGK